MKAKTFLLDWLGCKVNSYECDAFAKILTDKGMLENRANPDVIIINTCSVTSVSDKKSRQLISRYRREFPNAILCAMGCFCQSSDDLTLNEIKADIILGTNKRTELLSKIDEFEINHKKIIDISHEFRKFDYENYPIISSSELSRAYVKIQDGCDNFCSYCLIPYIRGRSRSRNESDIIEEINMLITSGYKEIVLTGIDVASYGLDFENKSTFSELLGNILTNCSDLYRLRISSIEESMIDDDFINLLKKYPNIASHMHMSLQSGSDTVLRRMNRKYNCDQFFDKICKIRKVRPDISLTTDVIVGFPGETDKEFNETVEFIKKCNFSKLHIFPYSRRKGTVAYSMKNQISVASKKERVSTLLELSDLLRKNFEKKFIGKEIEFLIESYDEKENYFNAHSSEFLDLKIKGEKGQFKIGEVVKEVYNFDNVKN
jgi:threonylcarbamoyladenosine tRNA methylthiotransferase MtaB